MSPPENFVQDSINAGTKLAGDMAAAGAEALKSFGTAAEQVAKLPDAQRTLEALKNQVVAILESASGESQEIIKELVKLIEAAGKPPIAPPAVNVPEAFQQIAQGISHAAEILYHGIDSGKAPAIGGGLMIAGGNIEIELQAKLPLSGGPGARTKIVLQISPKPYN